MISSEYPTDLLSDRITNRKSAGDVVDNLRRVYCRVRRLSLAEFKALCGALKASAAEEDSYKSDGTPKNSFETFLHALGSRAR